MKEFIRKNENKVIIGSVILIVIIIVWSSLLFFQEEMFFHTWNDKESYEKLKTIEEFEEINIYRNNKRINGWMKLNQGKDGKFPLVILFAGNASNSSNICLNFYNNSYYDYFDGYNVLIADYPGYGFSSGKPSDTAFFEMALSVYEYVGNLDYVDTNNIVIMGYSIGTGVATYLASERNVNGLILLAPYDNALSIYNDYIDIFHGALENITRYKFPSDVYAQNVSVSPLIIASKDDEIIDYNFSINLVSKFKQYEDFILYEGISHGSVFEYKAAYDKIYEYLQKRLPEYLSN